MKAYLEKIGKFEWLDDFVYISRQPLEDMGYQVIGFDGSDMNKFSAYDFQKSDIVVGSVEATMAFFEKMQIPIPKYLGYPESIRKYLGRNILELKFADIYDSKQSFPLFVKPANDVKKFTGRIIKDRPELDSFKKSENIQDDEMVYVSTPVDIISEYRCFIHYGVLKGIQWYRGDFSRFPNVEIIHSIIKDYKGANVAYTIDIGILKDGDNILIEVNDLWAIGSYGLLGQIYAGMVVDRFRQIMKLDTYSVNL
jgi:hypothetical protein